MTAATAVPAEPERSEEPAGRPLERHLSAVPAPDAGAAEREYVREHIVLGYN